MPLEGTTATQELEAFLVERAARDPSFRSALLADPREAISHELGVELTGAMTVEARETESGGIALTLPPDLDDLDSVALGQGRLVDDCCCCC